MNFRMIETDADWMWFVQRTSVIRCEDTQGIVAHDDRGVQAMCVADSFSTDSCNVHFAIDNPMAIKHGIFTIFADWVFDACGKKRMFGLVPDNNEAAIRLDKKIGFHEVARVPDAISDGVGYIVMRLNKEDCRWRTLHGQQEAA
jgi:RimJ/RimL family protein N-acetyltransferase